MGWKKWLFRAPILWRILTPHTAKKLREDNYNMLLLTKDDDIVGHTVFQRHDDALHMFSVSVKKEYEGRGYAKKLVEELVSYARQEEGVTKVRLSKGGHPKVASIVEGFRKREEELGIKAIERDEYGWFEVGK